MTAYRRRTLPCPACGSPMDEVPLALEGRERVAIDRCAHCGGAFLEFFDGEPIALARHIPERTSEAPVQVGTPRCPECERPMVEHRYLGEGPELARCEGCMAVFVDALSLGELRRATLRDPRQEEVSWVQRLLGVLLANDG